MAKRRTDRAEEIRRTLPRREHRCYLSEIGGRLELRQDEQSGTRIRMFIPYERRSVDLWGWQGGFVEILKRGAFARSLEQSDVVALYNHDPNWVLGRQSNRTLSIRDTADGLEAEVELDPAIRWHSDVAASIARRDVVGSSFGFETVRDEWTTEADGSLLRALVEVRLYDLSPVTFPAYPDSAAESRSSVLERAAIKAGVDFPRLVELIAAAEDRRIPEPESREFAEALERLRGWLPPPPTAPSAPDEDRRRRLAQAERLLRSVPPGGVARGGSASSLLGRHGPVPGT